MSQAIFFADRTFSEWRDQQLQAELKTCEKNPESEYWPLKSLYNLVVVGRSEHADLEVAPEHIGQLTEWSDLLLLACSKRKVHTAGLVPAGSRYDGGNFRVVKRARREGYAPRNLAILILSAKYGLISEKTMIEDYDQVMDYARAFALQMEVGSRLDNELARLHPGRVFVTLGQFYRRAIETSTVLKHLERAGIVRFATGRPGERQAQLRAWLQEPSLRTECPSVEWWGRDR